ncbi:type IV secretory system conjugative DNA transfer family protein [Nocardia stercoris]|uniref:Conjugal transfer protein n=1 Tax=Nocardia stercoris TaxID=2483361 RepID=A0A3M2KYQ3_9NOCA|nr:type IV secretory system conjugative DNA transfer family protein [Nocardia stercoris]RMI30619.1 conjugal transfer protein [Nocardia stercoris]
MAKKLKDPAEVGPDRTLQLIYFGATVIGTLWVAFQVGNWLAGSPSPWPIYNPISIVAAMFRDQLHWPTQSTIVVFLIIASGVLWLMVRKERAKRKQIGRLAVDDKADYMGQGSAIGALFESGVREKAKQLDVRTDLGLSRGRPDRITGLPVVPGVPLGVGVADGVPLYGSMEDLHIDIWGPRQGKSSSRVIPAILAADGPIVATSNKRDVVDATREVRELKGSPVFVFDPQGVAGTETPSWYWNPLRWVNAPRPGCEMRAAQLAGHFADADNGGSDSKGDAYFDQEAEDLLASLFLAASTAAALHPEQADRWTVMTVWEWVTNVQNPEPIEILRQGYRTWVDAPGLEVAASGLSQQYNTDPRTRSGIFGTAKQMINCLKMSDVIPWVSPRKGGTEFNELAFLQANGTLYSLSLEGRGSAAPLVSALTAAVIDTAMREAARSPHGRLPVPLLAVLDEAANVVRWKDLPKQYSHFGSRGIVVMTVLQSWAQGARCWGEDGMAALWSAANVKVIGSGIDDTRFLTDRSEAIGDYEYIAQSMSESSGGKSYSRSLSASKTFNVNALVTMPRGRVVVFTSGAPAVLVRTVPWWEGPYAEAVEHSIARHEPGHHNLASDVIEEQALTTVTPPATYGQPEEVQPL